MQYILTIHPSFSWKKSTGSYDLVGFYTQKQLIGSYNSIGSEIEMFIEPLLKDIEKLGSISFWKTWSKEIPSIGQYHKNKIFYNYTMQHPSYTPLKQII